MPSIEQYENPEPMIVLRLSIPKRLADRIDVYGRDRFPDRNETARFLINLSMETIASRRRIVDRRG
jgi:hypothetical protein